MTPIRRGRSTFSADTWVKMSKNDVPTTCVSTGVGIRYRDVQVLISAEDGGQGAPSFDLEAQAG